MTQLIFTVDNNGDIANAEYVVDHDYTPNEDEIIADSEKFNHRELWKYKVENGEIVIDENARPPGPINREDISQEQIQSFLESQQNNNIQQQIDILFQILTGKNL